MICCCSRRIAQATTIECMTAVELAMRRLCAHEVLHGLDIQTLVSHLTVALSDKVTSRVIPPSRQLFSDILNDNRCLTW